MGWMQMGVCTGGGLTICPLITPSIRHFIPWKLIYVSLRGRNTGCRTTTSAVDNEKFIASPIRASVRFKGSLMLRYVAFTAPPGKYRKPQENFNSEVKTNQLTKQFATYTTASSH